MPAGSGLGEPKDSDLVLPPTGAILSDEPEQENEPAITPNSVQGFGGVFRQALLRPRHREGTYRRFSSPSAPFGSSWHSDDSNSLPARWRLQRAALQKKRHADDVFSFSLAKCFMWLSRLQKEYGTRLLLLLFASQHLLKGFVHQCTASSVMWLMREYKVTAPQIQVYMAIFVSAWALKPMIGMASDLLPICGIRKAPYIIIASCIGVSCSFAIGISTQVSMGIGALVFCIFGVQLQASTNDLLTEALYSERIHASAELGPDLIAYIWGGITVGNMVAIATVTALMTSYGPRAVFLAALVPAAAILYPTAMNYFDEVKYTEQDLCRVRSEFLKQREVVFVGLLMTLLTIFMTMVGVLSTSHTFRFYCSLFVIATVLVAVNVCLRPEIAKVNTFFMLQAALSVNISGASFYFYVDNEHQYKEGPHFSQFFFTTWLGLATSVTSFVGLMVYTIYLKKWRFQSLLLVSNLLATVLALLDVILFRRLNLTLGIPDALFVTGSSVGSTCIRQWQWMPGIVLLSQLCPVGMEATIFALMGGCMNLGSQIGDFMGAYLLDALDVHPVGATGESNQFTNLWRASAFATLLPAVTISMIPILLPKGRQTEALLMDHPASATFGSPLWRLMRGDSETLPPTRER